LKLPLQAGAVRDRLLQAGRWSVLLCLVSIPVNKPATNIFIFLALLCALLGSGTVERFRAAFRHPVALGALAWFAYLFIAALLGPPGREGWETVSSHKALLYPLIVMSLIDSRQWRDRALVAFCASVGAILLVSMAQFTVAIASGNTADLSGVNSFTIFKNYTQQGIAQLVMASLAAAYARIETDRRRRIALWAIAAIAVCNVIFALQSRTAYLIVLPLVIYWLWQLAGGGRKSVLTGILILTAVSAAAISTPRVQQRLEQAQQEVFLYSKSNMATSLGIRIELWKNTVPIIKSAPWFGHGPGQWNNQYEATVLRNDGYNHHFVMGHPHQEALLIWSELGIAGLAALVALLTALTIYARRLDPPYRDFYTCLVLIYVTAGLANCVLNDFSHRHVFLMMLALIPLAERRT
jgi:O-antigen ligase